MIRWRAPASALVALAAILLSPPAAADTRVLSRASLTEPLAYEQIVRSSGTRRDYRVRVWAPMSSAARTPGAAGALFVLDGQSDAGLAAAIAREAESVNPAAARWVITVSPATDEVAQSFRRPDAFDGGDYPGFAGFLADELLPLLRDRHGFTRANLLGTGNGGRAALESLARDPDAFALVLAADPAIDEARVCALADAIPPPAQPGHAPKLVLSWTSAPHMVAMPLMILPQSLAAGGRPAEWHVNLGAAELIAMGLSK